MISIFHEVSERCSMIATKSYSTSFSLAIRLLHKDLRQHIYSIYGFVRFADEIVDSFHGYDKASLLFKFREDTFEAIRSGISLNPILNSFSNTVNRYHIDHELIHRFFESMEMDLDPQQYDEHKFSKYVFGSAESVGLMCLFIFCEGDRSLYEKLKWPARHLGAAFQKVNFLRDLKADFEGLARMYFPGCDFFNFTETDKERILENIKLDFDRAFEGILRLPLKARFGVYVAYKYYMSLFKKIKRLHPGGVLETRIRIPNHRKLMILLGAGLKNRLGLIS